MCGENWIESGSPKFQKLTISDYSQMHDCNLDVYFIYIERELNPQTEIAKWLIDCRRERRLWIYILHVLIRNM